MTQSALPDRQGGSGPAGVAGPNDITSATTTNITGVLKGNGSAISGALAGTDYYAPGGTDVAIVDGGTGASSAVGARTNLGVVPGTDVQAQNANLQALTAFTTDTDTALAANSDTKLATQKAVKAYADSLIAANDAMVFKGVIDASANPNYPAADRGHTYKISVAGKIGGASGINVEVGDLILCITDSTVSGNQATVGAAWTTAQVNIDGQVIGPTSATDNRIAVYDGTSGKLIKDSGSLISDLIPKSLYDANSLLYAVSDNTPAPLTVAASRIIARLASGDLVAATPAELRTLLTLVIGTDVQAWDADLDAIAALTSVADRVPYSTGAQAWALATLTTFGRSLIDDQDAAAARATLGVPALTFNKSLTGQPAIANTETVVLSYTCAANELAVGTTFRVKAFATRAGTQSASCIARIRVGTTTLSGNIAAILTPPLSTLAVGNEFEALVTVITNGSGGTVRGSWVNRVHLAAVTIGDAIASTAAVAVDTTVANMLIEFTFISGHASNTYTFQNATIEKVVA